MFENTEYKGVPLKYRTKLNGIVYEPIAISVYDDNERCTERVPNGRDRVWSDIGKAFGTVANAFRTRKKRSELLVPNAFAKNVRNAFFTRSPRRGK
jgi:hypothetical protein